MNEIASNASVDCADDYAVVTAPETVRLERVLPGPIERVWSYLVEPGKRKLWFADGPMDLRVGGDIELIRRNAELSPNDAPPPGKSAESRAPGRITALEAPHRIALTWAHPGDPDTEATFELTPRGDKVVLVVTHRRLITNGLVLGLSAGWHTHLAVLQAKLEQTESPDLRQAARGLHQALRDVTIAETGVVVRLANPPTPRLHSPIAAASQRPNRP